MFKFMQAVPVYNAEGANGGGNGGGGDGVGAADGGAAAAADGTVAETAKPDAARVAVDGTVPEDAAKPDADAKAEGAEGEKPAVEGEGDKTDDKAGDEAKPDAFAHKAEEYTFVLPDGAEPDAAQAEQFTAFALENKVPPELAQKLVDFHADVMAKQVKAWTDTVAAWGEATKTDKEYGGTGYEANMATANRALKEFGSPALGEAARTYGWGNHPEFVRFMFNVGRALGNGTTEKGGANGNVGNSIPPSQALYGA